MKLPHIVAAVCTVLNENLGEKGNIHNSQTVVVLVGRRRQWGLILLVGPLQKDTPAMDRTSVPICSIADFLFHKTLFLTCFMKIKMKLELFIS